MSNRYRLHQAEVDRIRLNEIHEMNNGTEEKVSTEPLF